MSSRRRLRRSLATAAVMVTVFAIGARLQPLDVAAQAQTATLWGIDSCDPAQSVVPATEQAGMGTPQFIGRYLGPNNCGTPGLSASEASYLDSIGVSILLISDPDGFGSGNPGGASEAQTAIQEAKALGAPPGTAIFRDVEVSWPITAAYIESWYRAFADSGSGYVPGFYDNSWNTGGPFAGASGAWCSAVGADSALASGVALWSDEYQYGYDSGSVPTRATAPAWDPALGDPYLLPCANTTVAWQYEIHGGMPSGTPSVDVDEFLSSYSNLLWGGGAYTPLGNAGAYTALTPYRICDTRQGTGTACSGSSGNDPIGPGRSLSMFIAGVPGPQNQAVAADAQEVVLNITAIAPTASTFLTVYPTGSAVPGTSNMNVLPGEVAANLAVVPLGSGGQVSIYNLQGATNVAVDVEGYFAAPSSGGSSVPGLFHPIAPLRICDTRAGTGTECSGSPLGVGQWTKVTISGLPSGVPSGTPSVPGDGTAAAVVMNLTAVSGTQDTFLSVAPPNSSDACPSGASGFSNLNVRAGTTRPNRVIVPLGPNHDVCVYNLQGSINFILDVNGWFGTGGEAALGADFYAIAPTRVCDTRSATGLGTSTECSGTPLGTAQSLIVGVAGVDGLPAPGGSSPPVAVIANVTAVSGTASTFLTAYPADRALPLASDLNPDAGQVIPNLVVVQLATTGSHPGAFDLYNLQGTINAVVDVQGWFQ